MKQLIKTSLQTWQKNNAFQHAAALSYYTIFALAPLLIIAVSIAGFFLGKQDVQNQIILQATNILGPNTAEIIQSMIQAMTIPSKNILGTIIGLIGLFFGASGVFLQLQNSLNNIWEVKQKPSGGIKQVFRNRVLSFLIIFASGFLLIFSVLLTTAINIFTTFAEYQLPWISLLFQFSDFVVLMTLGTLLFAGIYKILPNVKIHWKDVWIGGAITAFLVILGKYIIGFYISYSSVNSAYGAAGSLLVLLIWIYYTAIIILLGAEFTKNYCHMHGGEVTPKSNAEFIHPQHNTSKKRNTIIAGITGSIIGIGVAAATLFKKRNK